MGEAGGPQGVVGVREATGVKPSSWARPVPPMMAMWTGSERRTSQFMLVGDGGRGRESSLSKVLGRSAMMGDF